MATAPSIVRPTTVLPLRPLSAATPPPSDVPVVRYLNALLGSAVRQRASDIHLEPTEVGIQVRWRVDGKLVHAEPPPADMRDALISRVKILAKLDISEKRLPQDGHIKHVTEHSGRTVEFRVSSLPTVLGEKVVIRILDQDAASLQVETLGLDRVQLAALQRALSQPHGMILVTGPTGSGKTVTLYSCLQALNSPDVNISTVEDPSEIRLPGITQVNVNEKAGLTFASSMRAFLRQDPDIIMVGEIRDAETADIAIKAAQTGHLVLSTLHTNDAPATLNRLLNMGVPAFNVAASVTLICAQRLVRRLCEQCKAPTPLSGNVLASLGLSSPERERLFYKAVGCPQCVGGYRGRIGVFQIMPVSQAIAQAMVEGQSAEELGAIARREGVLTLRQSALRKAIAGLTSLDEVLAHTRDH
jgi:type IV pilus assembly protein PilB